MLGIFCCKENLSNEEFKAHIKKKTWGLTVLLVIGIISLVALILLKIYCGIGADNQMAGYYTGFCGGLVGACIVFILKNRAILKDEEKLKKAKIEMSDERNAQINTYALKVALAVLFVGMYFIMLIGGLWYPVLTEVLTTIVLLFLASYMIARGIISKRM